MSVEDPLYFELYALEIRLLKVAPGGWDDEIECELTHASLPNKPIFDALSYAWGSPKTVRSIILNRKRRGVTESAHQALRRLRQIYGAVTVWIDALCINQSDNKERTQQVGIMRDIFTSARQVFIYLGEVQNSKLKVPSKSAFFQPEPDDDIMSSFATRCSLQDISKIPRIDKASDVFCLIHSIAEARNLEDAAPFNAGWRHAADSKYHRRLFEALRQLMRCRWWDRMWTLQEAVVPKDVTIIYGPCVSTWDMFTRAAKAYSDHKPSETFAIFPPEYTKVLDFYSQIVLSIETMRRRWASVEQTTLLPLLRQFSGRNATDPRDRVYALLGLVRGRLPVQPDYSIDVATLYQHTALGIISSTGTLSVLNGDTGRKLRQDLPSWVPDWTAEYHDLDRHRAETIYHYATSLQSSVYVKSVTFKDLRGIEDVLEHMWTERHGKYERIPLRPWEIYDYTDALGTSDWMKYLPSLDLDSHEEYAKLLEVIKRYLRIERGQFCLEEYGYGIISLLGVNLREIVTVGAVNMAGIDLIPTIQSWSLLAAKQTGHGAGWHAFMRTLCADIIYPSDRSVSGCRRVCPEDLKAIAHWFIHQSSSPFGEREVAKNHQLFPIRCGIEKHFPEDESSKELCVTLDVKHSILLATSRRAFFITNEGSFGLGPAQVSPQDRVYAFLGAKTPFVLRSTDSGNILQKLGMPSSENLEYPRFKIMGDCFLHGSMDGEAMELWQQVSSATVETPFSLQERITQLGYATHHLKECRTAQTELEGALSALNGDKPIRRFISFASTFRRERLRASHSISDKDAELLLLHDPESTTSRKYKMTREDPLAGFYRGNVKKAVAMAIRSADHDITEVLEFDRSAPGDSLAGGMMVEKLHRDFTARLGRVEQLVDESKIIFDAKKVELVELMQTMASKQAYIFLI